MRALSACLTVLLGLGMVGLAACSSSSSDDSTAGGSGGASGGSAGATTAGSGGDIGAAGAGPECSFTSDACTMCVAKFCGDEFGACQGDDTCMGDLGTLGLCLCNGSTSTTDCETAFTTDGGDPATQFATCVNTDCQAECE
jgi:hypothetical protein